MLETEGFLKYNNITIVKAEKDEAICVAKITDNSLNPYKIVHGGLIFTLGDTVMGVHARSLSKRAVTLNASIDFLRPGRSGNLTAKSKIIKNGKTICVLIADIYDDENTLIATMRSSYYYID